VNWFKVRLLNRVTFETFTGFFGTSWWYQLLRWLIWAIRYVISEHPGTVTSDVGTSECSDTWCRHIWVLWHIMSAHLSTTTHDAGTSEHYDTQCRHVRVLWNMMPAHLSALTDDVGTSKQCDTWSHNWAVRHVMPHLGTLTRDVGTSGYRNTSYCHGNHHAEAHSL
jgi:hypothetical protein